MYIYVIICYAMLFILQTAAEVVPHPEWDRMVYFVCSSLKLKEPVAGSKGTQEELLQEAQLEVQELKQLVMHYICKQSPSGKATSLGKSSVCVMFPTRLTVSAVCATTSYSFGTTVLHAQSFHSHCLLPQGNTLEGRGASLTRTEAGHMCCGL